MPSAIETTFSAFSHWLQEQGIEFERCKSRHSLQGRTNATPTKYGARTMAGRLNVVPNAEVRRA